MNWFQWRKAERDLDEEIREHIEIETKENIERGMPPHQARYAAIRKFGNATRVKEQVHEMRIGLFFETVAQDALSWFQGTHLREPSARDYVIAPAGGTPEAPLFSLSGADDSTVAIKRVPM